MNRILALSLWALLLTLTGCGSDYHSYHLPDTINGRVKKITVISHSTEDPTEVIYREQSRFSKKRKLLSYSLREKKFRRRVTYRPRKYASEITYQRGETDRFSLRYNHTGRVVMVKDLTWLPNGEKELYGESYRYDSAQRVISRRHLLNNKVITSFEFEYHSNDRLKRARSTLNTSEGRHCASFERDSSGTLIGQETDTVSVSLESLIKSEDHWFNLGMALEHYYDVVRGSVPGNAGDSKEWLGVDVDISLGQLFHLKPLEQDRRNNPTRIEMDGRLYTISYAYY